MSATNRHVRHLMAQSLIVGIKAQSVPEYYDLIDAQSEFHAQPSDPCALGIYVWATIVEDSMTAIMDQVGTKDMEDQHEHD